MSAQGAARTRRAAEAFGNASSAIGEIQPEMQLFLLTRGQFSMIDAILHVLAEIGPAHVSVWTWAVADYEVEAMAGLMARESILGGRLIVDPSADKRSPQTLEAWRRRFGDEQVRIVQNHAKIARAWNDQFRVLLRGSCNLNYNPRFEQMDISEGGPAFELVAQVEEELPVLPRKYGHAETVAAAKLGLAFEASELKMFGGIKTWAK